MLVQTAHHGRGGCGLVHLVLSSLNFGLQMGRRVEVLALFPGTPALDVVHAHGDGVVIGVDHGAVCGVGEAAVVFAPRAVAPLIFPTYLGKKKERSKFSTAYGHGTIVPCRAFPALCICVFMKNTCSPVKSNETIVTGSYYSRCVKHFLPSSAMYFLINWNC